MQSPHSVQNACETASVSASGTSLCADSIFFIFEFVLTTLPVSQQRDHFLSSFDRLRSSAENGKGDVADFLVKWRSDPCVRASMYNNILPDAKSSVVSSDDGGAASPQLERFTSHDGALTAHSTLGSKKGAPFRRQKKAHTTSYNPPSIAESGESQSLKELGDRNSQQHLGRRKDEASNSLLSKNPLWSGMFLEGMAKRPLMVGMRGCPASRRGSVEGSAAPQGRDTELGPEDAGDVQQDWGPNFRVRVTDMSEGRFSRGDTRESSNTNGLFNTEGAQLSVVGESRSRRSSIGSMLVKLRETLSPAPNTSMLRPASPDGDFDGVAAFNPASSSTLMGTGSMSWSKVASGRSAMSARAILDNPMQQLRTAVDVGVLQANDQLMPETISAVKKQPTKRQSTMGVGRLSTVRASCVGEAQGQHIHQRLQSIHSPGAASYLYDWCSVDWLRSYGVYLKAIGVVPLLTESETAAARIVSVMYCVLIGCLIFFSLVYNTMAFVLRSRSESSKAPLVHSVGALMIPIAAGYMWSKLYRFHRSPVFVTFIEYAQRKDFMATWHANILGILIYAIASTTLGITFRVLGGSQPPPAASEWPFHLGPLVESEALGTMLCVCDCVVIFVVFAANAVFLVCCKFAHLSAYIFAQEVLETVDIRDVPHLWSVFIIITRSLSMALCSLFLVITSLSIYLFITMLLLGMSDYDTAVLFIPSWLLIVFGGLTIFSSAADIKENSMQAISLINMIDFQGDEEIIDHEKHACVAYLKACEIGFLVKGQPVSMGVFILNGYVFIGAIITMAAGVLGV